MEDLQNLLIIFSVPEFIVVIHQLGVISILVDLIQVSLGTVYS